MLHIKKKKNAYFIFFALSFLFFLYQATYSMNRPPMDNIDFAELLSNDPEFINSSPEKQAQMLETAQKVSDDFKKITPEQWQEIEEMTKKMEVEIEKMGGEEKLKELMQDEDKFANFINGFATNWEKEKKEKATVKEEQKPEPKKFIPAAKIPLSGQELLLENLQGIINSINSFLAKAAAMPELSGKVEIWAKNNIITEWGPTITWSGMQKQIQVLLYKLNALVAIDQKTQKRRYFNYIYENEALKNHLSLLKKNLAESESFIDVSTFGLTKLEDQTKKSIQKVIDHLGQAILKLKLNDTINSTIEKYEPIAQEIRSIEEKLLKEAEAESKKGTAPGKVIQTAGSSRAGAMPSSGGYAASRGGAARPSYAGSGRQTGYPRTGGQDYYDYGRYNNASNYGTNNTTKTGTSLNTPKADEINKKKKEESAKPDFKPSEESKQINALQQEIESILDSADMSSTKNSLLMKIKNAELTAFDYKTKKILKEIVDSLKVATKAVRKLYDNTQNHIELGKKVTTMVNKIEPLFKELEKHYKLPESEKKITEARTKLDKALQELNKEKSQKGFQEKEQAKEQALKPGEKKQISEKEKNFNTEKENVKRLIEQELKVPAEVSPLLDEYSDLLKALKRFSKKPLPTTTAPQGAPDSKRAPATKAATV